ncbi:MAG: hypothetical protein HGA90_00670 [Alphaproteobacteria bacterium]|nr:hypothetical protein [Alphaproteobacteria bacterium]
MVYVQPQTIEYRTVGPAYVSGGYMDGDYAERSSQISSSSYCREFTQQVRIDGRLQESYGTACLQSDGSWKIER